ncbi:MAG TPA: nucleotidyltransferase family protein [Methanocorpusculum sp.]|nr:nucleotidyltransferase family protein [Methanocorpusculum sp.]
MSEYVSIRNEVLSKLEAHLGEIQERFGVDTLGLFGSVSRGEDTPDSDIDILFTFKEGKISFSNLIYLEIYLKDLLGREIDLIPADAVSRYMLPSIKKEVISLAS